MVFSGHGIVLGFIKYGDTSVIARIFTKDHGLTSFLIHGVFRKKAGISASMIQPFTVLEMVYYIKENRQINKIKEVRISPHLNGIQTNIVKSSLAIFASEVLQNTLGNTEQDDSLFEWVKSKIIQLNSNQNVSPYWAHKFLLGLAGSQGFSPSLATDGRFFHLKEGVFTNIPLADSEIMKANETRLLRNLIEYNYENLEPKEVRSELLNKLLDYFSHHVGGFRNLKSIDVLRNVLN